MADINWCKKQKKGIKLIEPNDNLSRDYMQSAEETLSLLKDLEGKSRMWLATTKYYSEYFAVYSFLMKIGVKSEIHDCTISLSDFLEKENFLPKGTFQRLEADKKLRIDNQYYLKNRVVELDYDNLVEFILKIKSLTTILTLQKINQIREKIKNL